MPSPPLPDRARIVVIGGGVIGTSVAYHLAHLGQDVLLLERDRLTSGTTWHAAGLMVTFGSTSQTSTEMRQYTRDLYRRLEQETGQSTGLKQVGFIEIATEPDRLEEYRRVSAFNRLCGVDVQEIGPDEVESLFPIARTDDILAGFYVAEDGRANPVDVTMALAKGARAAGARIVESVAVRDVVIVDGAVSGVRTDQGEVQCEFVVNCAGMWARQLAELSGVSLPLQAAEHYYLITEPFDGIEATMPVLEDPASYGYYREEGGGLMLGMFEGAAAPWNVGRIPDTFSFGEISPDWDRMGPYLEQTMSRVPVSQEVGVRKFFCGPESFTPDMSPLVGEAPEVRGYFVAAGLNSVGILTAGGLGRAVAHWIVDGDPGVDVTGMNVDRLEPYQATPAYRAERVVETLGNVYKCHYPTKAPRTARGARRGPLYERLVAQGAFFRDVSGWESADWYAGPGQVPTAGELSWGRQSWFDTWAAEHRAAREGVIVMDMSFMSKFLVEGRDAAALLQQLSANDVDDAAGQITYTQWLNERGTIEADLTVTKLGDEKFWVVASDTARRHAHTWLRRHLGTRHAFVADVTSAYAQLNVQGPRSRELLQSLTAADLSNEAFPFRAAREIDLGFARVLCIRITYLGELGYELYVPAEQATHVYDRIVAAGREHELTHAGLKSLASLRMEKGYRDYGHDIDNTDSVLEAGLGFAVALDKPGGFLGRDAVAARKAEGPLTRRLLQVLVRDPEPLLFHAEPVLRDGTAVGYVRAASYGHTLGGAVGLAMVDTVASGGGPLDASYLSSGEWEVEVAGRRYPALASLRPLYDPTNERIKA
ncbi:MAG TPA: FAD-dependent oxidoreductase [Candidatus Nanopelagicales bacterium]|jgi:4-methylaminobutanoate oxidase (formaldehyde-forming)|nr:FAD-dependent oxidoreductase [Candidatus Nanopelagicales bacterium]